MKIVNYVYFEKQGERSKLEKLAKESMNESELTIKIQDEFKLDIIAATQVSQKFFNKFKNEK